MCKFLPRHRHTCISIARLLPLLPLLLRIRIMIGPTPSCAMGIQKSRTLSYRRMRLGPGAAALLNLLNVFFFSQVRNCSGGMYISLGGSAPCLRFLHLAYIPFPRLPKLLLSATHLTDLRLLNVPHSGYISPEAMVSCLSALTRLGTLILDFEPPKSEHRRPPPSTRTLLPALTRLQFYGFSEYLEDLVVRIDTPLLDKAHNEVHVVFHTYRVNLTLRRVFEKGPGISHEVVDLQVLSVAQICTSFLSQAFSATVERLYIRGNYECWRGDIRVENNLWLELLRPFTSVKSLYLSRVNSQCIAPALQGLIGESVAGVLPALQTLFLEDLNLSGPVQEAIGSFVSGRQFSGHPVDGTKDRSSCKRTTIDRCPLFSIPSTLASSTYLPPFFLSLVVRLLIRFNCMKSFCRITKWHADSTNQRTQSSGSMFQPRTMAWSLYDLAFKFRLSFGVIYLPPLVLLNAHRLTPGIWDISHLNFIMIRPIRMISLCRMEANRFACKASLGAKPSRPGTRQRRESPTQNQYARRSSVQFFVLSLHSSTASQPLASFESKTCHTVRL